MFIRILQDGPIRYRTLPMVLNLNDPPRPKPATVHLPRIASLVRNDSAPILGHKIVIGMGMAVTPQINSVLLHQPA